MLERGTLQGLEVAFRREGRLDDLRRLKDLQDPTVSHDRLRALSPNLDIKIDPDDYANAFIVRLGVSIAHEPAPCLACGRPLGPRATHAFLWSTAEGTLGHNCVRNVVHAAAHLRQVSARLMCTQLQLGQASTSR